MRTIQCWVNGLLAVFLVGCATNQSLPSVDVRQALAPTGTVRVAFIAGPIYAQKDAATGELKGVAVDLGTELARRVGLPFQPVVYPSPAAIVAAAKSGEWDVALMGISAERALEMDFSAPYMEVEQTYLVRAGVPITNRSDVDRQGVRVGVLEKAAADIFLSGALKSATLVRGKSVNELYDLLDSGKADVIAATTSALLSGARQRPGSRVLDGRILAERIGMGVPKGRDAAAAAYVGRYVEDAKADGFVKSAIERAGLRGAVVAPLK